ncbi:MAG: DUF2567 domain-containing protein [Actinomycetota bacterium]|nr:DUF2567 domain-containing protein [Actinomycetota bacterium]
MIVAVMIVVGAVLGALWQWWAPPGPLGLVIAPHTIQPDETESFVAGDGRFAIIGAATGLVAGIWVWRITRWRGPVSAFALAIGGVAGAVVTERVGHALAGGRDAGAVNTVISHISLTVHMGGLRLVEAAAALLTYGLLVAFAPADDLGRGQPPGSAVEVGSVGLGDHPEHRWGDGDGAGALQQTDLPSQ